MILLFLVALTTRAFSEEATCAAGAQGGCTEGEQSSVGRELFRWVAERGGIVDGIVLKGLRGSERGVFASRDLPDGHVLLSIPPEAVVTTRLAAETPLGKYLTQAVREGTLPDFPLDGLLLTAWLLEQSENEEWGAYFDSLPSHFPTMILNASDLSMETCGRGLELGVYLAEMRLLLKMEHEYLEQHRDIVGEVPWHRYLWARFVTFSRTFTARHMAIQMHAMAMHSRTKRLLPEVPTMPGKDTTDGSLLVPLVDLINHRYGPEVSCIWSFKGAEGFEVKTKRAVAVGEELFVTYGDKANDVFLTHYGFVEAGNRKDAFSLPLRLPGQDSLIVLVIRADMPAGRQELQEILESSRAAAKAAAGGNIPQKELEVKALEALLFALDEPAASLTAPSSCPDICVLYREGLSGLVDSWRRFVSNALLFLAGRDIDMTDIASKDNLRLHSRLYFGVWLSSTGAKLVYEDAAIARARVWGKVSYFDVADV